MKKEKNKPRADATPLVSCAVAKAPTSNQPPCGAQGRRLLGPAALRPCPFASRHGQVRARLGLGGYCRVLGTGVPRLACLRPAAWLKWGPSVAHLHQHKVQDPREGAKPHEADDMALFQARPP